MDNQNEISQQPVVKPVEPKRPPLLSKNTIILIIVIFVAFAIVYVITFSALNKRLAQTTQPQLAEKSQPQEESYKPNSENLSDPERPYNDDVKTWKTYDTTLFSLKHPPEITVGASSARNNVAYWGPADDKNKEYYFGLSKFDEYRKVSRITKQPSTLSRGV